MQVVKAFFVTVDGRPNKQPFVTDKRLQQLATTRRSRTKNELHGHSLAPGITLPASLAEASPS
jgi:hypothetical protein